MSREVYYVHPKVVLNVRGIAFLAVKGCLMVFDGLLRGLDFAVFGKLSLLYGALQVEICASAGVDQVVLVLKRVDGVFFHD